MYCGEIMVARIAAGGFTFWPITFVADEVTQSSRIGFAAVQGGARSAGAQNIGCVIFQATADI